jgi:hypothetical protein
MGGVMGTQIVGVIAATAVIFAVSTAAAEAQSLPATKEPFTRDNSPKTLFEAFFGRTPEEKAQDRVEQEERLEPDRPHFPEASTTVGKGRVMLESGYTFTTKDSSLLSHSYPEALLRVGIFANWSEFRIGQSFLNERRTGAEGTISANGAQDIYLGVKLALAEQKGLLPTIALIPQMTVPTGSREVTAGRALPGLNIDCSWEVVKNFFSVELLVANNLVQDDLGSARHELATGLTAGFQLTKNLEAFAEWDAFYPTKGIGSAGPRHYAVGGLVYFITPNLAVDARAGFGLNERSNTFLAGVGFAVRR